MIEMIDFLNAFSFSPKIHINRNDGLFFAVCVISIISMTSSLRVAESKTDFYMERPRQKFGTVLGS